MGAVIEIEATVTERGQTTVPAAIRNMLHLGKRGAIVFRGMADGTVVISNKEVRSDDDPVLGRFLGFLATDIAARPEAIRGVSSDLAERIQGLVGGIDTDIEGTLPEDDE
jgi:antitoxin PrlF